MHKRLINNLWCHISYFKVITWLLASSISYYTAIRVFPGSTIQVFCVNKLRLRAQVNALRFLFFFFVVFYRSKKVKQTIRHISVIHSVKWSDSCSLLPSSGLIRQARAKFEYSASLRCVCASNFYQAIIVINDACNQGLNNAGICKLQS